MLVRLYGRNFRSLKGDFELSLVAAGLRRKEDQDRGVIVVPIAGMPDPLRLLRVIGIYGANASGKSTVLWSGHALNWFVTQSSAQSQPGAGIPTYEPFVLDEHSRESPVKLGCDVVFEESLLRYEIVYGAKAIQSEVLKRLDGHGEDRLIDRPAKGEIGGRVIRDSQANRLYVEGMQPNVAVLSKLAQHGPQDGEESVVPLYRAIQNATRFRDYSTATLDHLGFEPAYQRFADDDGYRDWVMEHLMRPADVGIRDVQVRQEDSALLKSLREQFEKQGTGIALPDTQVVVSFIHEGHANRPVDFSRESCGTTKIFRLAGDWWSLAHGPVTLHADELGAGLHPRLLDRLVRAVNDAPATGAPSQLIFATHHIGLLESQNGQPPALRRDQVYFTKKDTEGATELYSLTEFKEEARPVHNIRKRYLSGLYGAIPMVEKLSL